MRLAHLILALLLGGALSVAQAPGVTSGTNHAPTAASVPYSGRAATPTATGPTAHAPTTRPTQRPVRTFSLLTLGDSITAGTASTDGTGYRGPLHAAAPGWTFLGTQGATPLQHEGYPGATIAQLRDHIGRQTGWLRLHPPAAVLLHAGTNDFGAGRTSVQAIADMDALLTALQAALPDAQVIVAQIPQTPYNLAGPNAQLLAYDDALPALAAAHHAQVVDMRGTHISTDRVHPDDTGYRHMADVWAAALPEVMAT